MIVWFLFGTYIILFSLGFYIDIRLSKESKDLNAWIAIPLTAPLIGLLIIIDKIKNKLRH